MAKKSIKQSESSHNEHGSITLTTDEQAVASCDQRIAELSAWAAQERLALPFPAHVIIAIEDSGGLVNLVTGEIMKGEAG